MNILFYYVCISNIAKMNSCAGNFCRMILVEMPMFVVQFFDFHFPSGVQEYVKIAFKIVNNPACTTRIHQDFF